MKIQAQFSPRESKLFFKDNGQIVSTEQLILLNAHEIPLDATALEKFACSFNGAHIVVVRVLWSSVELSEGGYDESFLAALRTFLKCRELHNLYEIIVPECGSNVMQSEESAVQFTAAMCHTARRIKDCASVIGFALPKEFSEQQAAHFIDAMSAKHAQYVYFSEQPTRSSVVQFSLQ